MVLTDKVRNFLNERRFAVLGTVNPDGTIHQSVMWYLLEGDTIVMNTRKGRVKFRNMTDRQNVSLCIEDERRYVTITGHVSFNEDQTVAHADIQRLGRRYDSEEQVRHEYETVWKHQTRVTLTMPIDTITTHGL